MAQHDQGRGEAPEQTATDTDRRHEPEPQRPRAQTGAEPEAYDANERHASAPRNQHAPGPASRQDNSPGAEASRIAVAANEAYRAGDLDRARQLTEQAAAVDPSRGELWQQHRQQITARQLILDAHAARAAGDHQQADTLLGQARQLDPRMPALWDGDLPAPRADQNIRLAREHDVPVPRPGDHAGWDRTAARTAGPAASARPASTGQAGEVTSRPSWPSSPARGQAQHGGPSEQQVDAMQTGVMRPRERDAHPGVAADTPDASTEPTDTQAGGYSPTRWPARNPRSNLETPPSRHGRHEAETGHTAAAESAVGHAPGNPAALSADWRDQIIQDAREPWQASPIQPYDPALLHPLEHGAPEPGIEPGA